MNEAILDQLGRSIASSPLERSSLDKVFAISEIKQFKALARKKELDREDLNELMYLIAGLETKLINLDKYERYVLAKFYVWIREFVSICEVLYDYKEKLEGDKNSQPTATARLYMANNLRLVQHGLKFLVDLFLMLSRSSLSVNAVGFRESLSNRFDVTYNEHRTQPQMEQTKNRV